MTNRYHRAWFPWTFILLIGFGGFAGRTVVDASSSCMRKQYTPDVGSELSSLPRVGAKRHDGQNVSSSLKQSFHELAEPSFGISMINSSESSDMTTASPTKEVESSANPISSSMLQKFTKIAMRVLHPSLVSSYCVARELGTQAGAVHIPLSEIVAMYCVHVFVFGADRLGDRSYDQRWLQGILAASVIAFAMTTNAYTGTAGLLFSGALVLYPLVKRVQYLKCVWVPLAFTCAASVGVNHNTTFTFQASAFLYYLGNCAACDIGDIEEDRIKGVRTFATLLGGERVRILSSFLTAASAVTLLSFYRYALSELCSRSGTNNFLQLVMALLEKPAVLGCIISTIIYTVGLLFTGRNPKDLDMLNTIPLLMKLAFQ
jgi:hypothetical protein